MISKSRVFFKNLASDFSTFIFPNFMQKIRKILRSVSEKTALPINQPTITNNNDFIGPGWRQSKNEKRQYACEKYQNLCKKEKTKKRKYYHKRYKNLSEDKKQRLVE